MLCGTGSWCPKNTLMIKATTIAKVALPSHELTTMSIFGVGHTSMRKIMVLATMIPLTPASPIELVACLPPNGFTVWPLKLRIVAWRSLAPAPYSIGTH